MLLSAIKATEMIESPSGITEPKVIGSAFDGVAAQYGQHDVLEREVGSRMMERLPFQRKVPSRIIDLGAGTGHLTAKLKREFPKSEVIGIDASLSMCQQTRKRSRFLKPVRAMCADFSQLPIAARSVDLLFSNLAFQWSPNIPALMAGFRRVLRPDGLLLFSTLGPDSMKEFRQVTAAEGQGEGVRAFADMHDIGDALMSAGFSEPVMDSEVITLEYEQFDKLVIELSATGADTHLADWERRIGSTSGRADTSEMLIKNGRFPVTWEIVYGAAFGPEAGQPIKTSEGDIASFPVELLRKNQKQK